MTTETTPRPQHLLLTVEEAAEVLRVGRTTIFHLIRTGELATVQIGRLRRVSMESLRQFTRERQG
ncbi:MAG: helix-turn-helix domain-containing protein [Actinomycetota bacterium]|nr:helix-turn-helix domain-containing protein [Actinomycetota bacterium]